jgi:hypothetical protein
MKLKIIVAACVLVTSGVVMADPYQVELGAKVLRFKDDSTLGGSDKLHEYEIDGAYYFNQVSTNNVPLAEAAYLGKNTNIFANLYDVPQQHNISGSHTAVVGGELYIPESFLYVQAGVIRTTAKHYTDNDWFTSVGITPIDGLLITTQYSHDSGYDANIHGKYVTAIGNDQYINVEAEITDADDGTIKAIGGDFYFDSTFSVGATISSQHSDNAYTIRTRKFFTEKFSGELSYTDYPDGNMIMGGLSVRF